MEPVLNNVNKINSLRGGFQTLTAIIRDRIIYYMWISGLARMINARNCWLD